MTDKKHKEYKIVHVIEGAIGTLFFGASGIPVRRMELILNKMAKEGWRPVFQVIEHKRYMLLWTREAVILTMERDKR